MRGGTLRRALICERRARVLEGSPQRQKSRPPQAISPSRPGQGLLGRERWSSKLRFCYMVGGLAVICQGVVTTGDARLMGGA